MNLAMSIDDYIANEKGDYAKFLEHINIVVIGNKSYEQGFAMDFKTKKVLVASHHTFPSENNIHLIKGDIVNQLQEEKAKEHHIYLFGGGILIDHFIKKNVIDEYIIGIIPIILGKGRPLFLESNPIILLYLDQYYIADGIVVFHYCKLKK